MAQLKMITIGLGLILLGAACLAVPLALPEESDRSPLWPIDGMLAIAGGVYIISWPRKLENEAKETDETDENSDTR